MLLCAELVQNPDVLLDAVVLEAVRAGLEEILGSPHELTLRSSLEGLPLANAALELAAGGQELDHADVFVADARWRQTSDDVVVVDYAIRSFCRDSS